MIRQVLFLLFTAAFVIEPSSLAAQNTVEHPRLFFNADQLSTLRSQATTTHYEMWAAFQSYTNSQLGSVPLSEVPPDATEEEIRSYGDQLIPLAFSCALSEQTEYCALTRDYLVAYAGWTRWDEGELRDLGLAHLLFGSSIAYDWIYSYLNDEDRRTIAAALTLRGQQMYEASSGAYNDAWTNWWAGSYVQNHFSTNNSALGIAGLALAGDTEVDTNLWVQQAVDEITRITFLLDQIQDGSWHEGITYQSYMLTMMLPFLVNLRSLNGIDLLPDEYLRNYVDWRLYNYLPGRHEFALGNGDFETWWGNSFEAQSLLRFAAREYNNPHAEWLAQQIIAITGRVTGATNIPWQVFEYLYYDPTIQPEDPGSLPLAKAFSDAGAVIWRTGWAADDLTFGLKGGSYGGGFPLRTFVNHLYPWGESCERVGCTYNVGHEHADANSFSIYKNGQWLTTEWIGYGVRDTSSHNTITIDGQNQFLPVNNDYASRESFTGSESNLTAYANGLNFNYVASDATGRYKTTTDIQNATRHVVFVKPDYFLMLDNLDADAAHDYYWTAHFTQGASLEDNWIRGEAEGNQLLAIGIVSPQPFDAIFSEDALPYVRIAPSAQASATRFINVLYPTDTESWDTRPSVTLVEDTGRAALTRVQTQDGRTNEILIEYSGNNASYTVSNYATDAEMVIITRNSDGGLADIALYGGTFLSDTTLGHMLVNNLNRTSPFEAEISGDTLSIHGEFTEPFTIFAASIENAFINDTPASIERHGDYLTFRN